MPTSVAETLALLDAGDYVADEALATVLFLAMRLGRPLLLEGEAGVGKTEIAKVLAKSLGRRLIRLQCYEGLDQAQALYDWNYARQMLEIRLAEAAGEVEGAGARERLGADLFSERFLLRRPLLDAITPDPAGPPVLLIDEIDRADEPFEAFLLELLADFQVTIPEIGTIRAETPPIVIVTSNRTREIHDALKRRCLYRWIDFPNEAREIAIVRRKTPAVAEAMAAQIVGFVQRLRSEDLFKAPGVAETLDWANALVQLDAVDLNPGLIDGSMGVLLKYQDDIARMTGAETARLLAEAQADIQRRANAGTRAATA
ncbi:ATPase [Tistrella bauzanensis]|uniref:ATPase n=1 Tax=Tistrella bauzanensis TaxID=657419 RepID=A0ABQ1I906_9PROT|nr:MoxR family ATPase [Tistrella bauzanensis]GGB25377.1 ATPase [Tistrella bauzanensis]